MIHLPEQDLSIYTIPKNGGTTLWQWVYFIRMGRELEGGANIYSQNWLWKGGCLGKSLIVRRDPVARFISGYRNFRDKRGLALDFETFVRSFQRLCEGDADMRHHFRPQSHFYPDRAINRFDHVIDFANFAEVKRILEGYSGVVLPEMHAQKAVFDDFEVEDEHLRLIREIYAEDYEKGYCEAECETEIAFPWLREPTPTIVLEKWFHAGTVKKLHLAGNRLIEGWLNTADSEKEGMLTLPHGSRWNLPDGSFDCIFFDRLLEKGDYESGRRILSQCHRVLKPGGRIRIAALDLGFFIRLMTEELTPEQKAYVCWVTDSFLPGVDVYDPVIVANHAIHGWGNRFLYDRDLLANTLESCGFNSVEIHLPGESKHPDLCGLEETDRLPHGFYGMETMVLEATKD